MILYTLITIAILISLTYILLPLITLESNYKVVFSRDKRGRFTGKKYTNTYYKFFSLNVCIENMKRLGLISWCLTLLTYWFIW